MGVGSETSRLEAGALWHRMTRENKKLGLKSVLTSFIPAGSEQTEILKVEITNMGRAPVTITPTAAIPLFGRSADNLRDHRHVTSLLHRIEPHDHGVLVTPTMSFDERGHHTNQWVYAVLGCEASGASINGSFPTVSSYLGEGGTFDAPRAVLEDWDVPDLNPVELQGREAVGALRFRIKKLAPGKSAAYLVFIGIGRDRKDVLSWLRAYGTVEKVDEALLHTQAFWKERLDRLQVRTDDPAFGRWVRWVSIQPTLRKIFGCSFLPDFDYGRGGRGWRDLWQDCLALLLLDSGDVRGLLLNNFAGVRQNGTNATIIGKKAGEFIADRNNISRTWMDHGVWPWITTEFYIHQTGDLRFLLENVSYFEGGSGTVLEHIVVQHLAACANLGEHGHCRLMDADWNDGLDMARERGESVAFTAMYAGNLLRLADVVDTLQDKLGIKEVVLSGAFKLPPSVRTLADYLRRVGQKLSDHVRNQEWVKASSGHAWFNGYYDNEGRAVEGETEKGVRMTLTGQVFPIMSGVATNEQVQQCFAAVKKYLQDKKLGGFRLNTDFEQPRLDLGRAFSFAYGEKENGAFFSHMVVMLANALYQRGFVEEGHDVLSSLYRMCMNADVARIYPGMPEYFNGEGRGLYAYLTGSASWYMLTLVTQVLGLRGVWGDLLIAPKLMPDQFGASGQAWAELPFAGKRIKITYINRSKKPYGQYRIGSLLVQGRSHEVAENAKDVVLPRKTLAELSAPVIEMTVSLT